jgi:hypothetical protein
VLLGRLVISRLYLRIHRQELVVQLHRLIQRTLIHVTPHLVQLGAHGLELFAKCRRLIGDLLGVCLILRMRHAEVEL